MEPLTIVIFIGLLLVLILAHEWGHFIAAKKAGCRVEEFGIGFPPRLFSWVWHDTRYSVNLLPIGGFVKIEGEDMQEATPGPTSFAGKSARWRITILAAGVAMNVVVAAALLIVQAGIGFPTLITEENAHELRDHQTYILDISPTSPAAEAGLKEYDRIVRLNDQVNPTITQIQEAVSVAAGSEVVLEVNRQGVTETITLVPRANPPAGEGPLGVSLGATGLTRVSWWAAPWEGLKRTGSLLVGIVTQFWQLLQQAVSTGSVGQTLTGPIGIAIYTEEAAKLGISYLLEFAALISLNLAIINILPLPALDGGRIMFVILEKVFRRRLPVRFEQLTHTVGLALLLMLMALITFNDIKRFFS